jgi:hypothetical protein
MEENPPNNQKPSAPPVPEITNKQTYFSQFLSEPSAPPKPFENNNHITTTQPVVPSKSREIQAVNQNQEKINLGISIGQFHPLTIKYLNEILIPALKKYTQVILIIEKSKNKDPNDIFSDENVKEMIKKSILEIKNHTNLASKLIIITIPDNEIMISAAKSRKVRKILRKYNIESNNISNYNPEYNWYYIFGKILKKYFSDKKVEISIFGPKNEDENLLNKYLELIKLISLKISESENIKNNFKEFKNNGNMNLSSTIQELLRNTSNNSDNSDNSNKMNNLLKYVPKQVLEIIYKNKPELLNLLSNNTKPVENPSANNANPNLSGSTSSESGKGSSPLLPTPIKIVETLVTHGKKKSHN